MAAQNKREDELKEVWKKEMMMDSTNGKIKKRRKGRKKAGAD